MDDALVSVILPVYNCGSALKTCINSILSQTYQNIELLVVDDGSTDDSMLEARLFHDARVKVIKAEHKGVSHARNIALENVTGQFFTFIDADDFVADTYVEVMLSDILTFDADIAFTRIEFHYQNESFDYQKAVNEKCQLADRKQVIESCFVMDDNLRGYNAGVCGRMFRSDFYYKDKELFDEEFSYGEDAKWLFQMVMRAEKIVLDEKTLYHYNRVRGKYTDYLANIRYYTWRLSFFREHGLPERMITSTENVLYSNQFAYLLQKYQKMGCYKERIRLVRQYSKLGLWLIIRREPWNLGRIKTIGCYWMMRFGFPGKQVGRIWNIHRSR